MNFIYNSLLLYTNLGHLVRLNTEEIGVLWRYSCVIDEEIKPGFLNDFVHFLNERWVLGVVVNFQAQDVQIRVLFLQRKQLSGVAGRSGAMKKFTGIKC